MPKNPLFRSASSQPKPVPVATTTNHAGGKAYSLSADEALAQVAVTGCFGQTFYASGKSQLDDLVKLAQECSDETIADVAIYSRRGGYMKDMPVALLAVLAGRKTKSATTQLRRAFPLIVDNGRMLRGFVQMIRSGKFGRKSLGTVPKSLVRNYLTSVKPEKLLRDSVGNDPSLLDVIKMVHPRPGSKSQEAMFAYLADSKKLDEKKQRFLPLIVKEFERFKKGEGSMPEGTPLMLLTAHARSEADWLRIAKNASWTETRINLAAFNRHGVFKTAEVTNLIANRLRDPTSIRKSKVFPYQLLTAYQNTTDVPAPLRNALQDALEVATENVPALPQGTVVGVDVSGSMGSPVIGGRGTATGVTRCVDVAGLIASVVLRTTKDAEVIPFDTRVHSTSALNPRDSVITNAAKLARFGGGGTDCSLVLADLNRRAVKAPLVIYVSDNESWADRAYGSRTGLMTEWAAFKKRNPKAKLVLIDLTPNTTSQAAADKDILRVGGFSDAVFTCIDRFVKGEGSFLDQIRNGSIDSDLEEKDLTHAEA